MLRLIMLLKEPSTYGGIAGFLGALGIYGLSADDWSLIIAAPMAIAAAVAVFLPDRADRQPPRRRFEGSNR